MSMNLALQKGKDVDFETPFQTPTTITKAILASKNPTEAYKKYVMNNMQYDDYIINHFDLIDEMIEDGYVWIMI